MDIFLGFNGTVCSEFQALIYSGFSNGISIANVVMIAFDGLLGTLVTGVTWYLFPRRCKDKDGIVREIASSKES
jgi:hypothetical protein